MYVLEGSAILATSHDLIREQEASARFVLYVEDDVPSYFRDESFGHEHGRFYDLIFEADREVSEPIELQGATGTCTVRVRRDGCAELEFEGCFRLHPRSDSGHLLTGSWSVCLTDEAVVRRLEVLGTHQPQAITPDGAVRLRANYRLDPTADAIEVRVNGEVRDLSWVSDADETSAALGPVPPNSELTMSYAGTRADVDFAHATPFVTTADADLTLATVVDGSLDARGEPVTLVDGTLEVRRTSSPPHPPFAFAFSLGEVPDDVSSLALTATTTSFGSVPVHVFLVRADGSYERQTSNDSIAVPEGSGAAWLVVTHEGTYAPDGAFGSRFSISALAWE